MNDALSDVGVEVALECYKRVRRLRDGSPEEEAAEHAILMALSSRRDQKDKPLLLHDVLQDGRRSTTRSRARYLTAVQESGHLAQRGVATGGTRAFVETETPEDICIARDLVHRLKHEAGQCGSHGPRVLEGLLDGETTREMATATGVSPVTVKRTVRRLRAAAVNAGYREAA